MSVRRKNLQYLSKNTLQIFFLIFYTISFCISASWAFAKEDTTGLLLSSFGLTDKQFEKKAKEYVGVPYRIGGTSKKGMDCSGFARVLYDKLFSIELPHNSIGQYRFSELQKISSKGMQPGDLVFFGNKKKRINHVGVYLSNGRFIHASSTQGITVSRLNDNYWQKRFVGSKRYMTQNLDGEDDQIQVAGSVSIPVHQNGTITGDVRHDFWSRSATTLDNSLESFQDAQNGSREFDNSNLHFYQIGYNHSIQDGLSVNVNAFGEKYATSTAWTALYPYSKSENYRQDGLSSDPAVRRGFKVAGDIRPSNWFSISPSITYFNNSMASEESWDVPRRTLGLNSLLAPNNGHWSLTMQLQYSDQQSLMNATTFDNTHSSLDMAVKLGVNLTENLQLSVMGKHDFAPATNENTEASSSVQTVISDIFFTLDLAY